MEYNYKLTIAYDGTNYSGWQIQPNGISIQQKINEVLTTLLNHEAYCIGSGRTDAGVHANAQVAHFLSSKQIDFRRFLYSLNSLLPKDIKVTSIENVPLDFHARYSAKGKIYHYHLHISPFLSPFNRLYALHVYYPLDIALLKKAATCFVGTHDFTAFANDSHLGAASYDPVRTIKRIDVVQTDDGLRLEFEADGFLYKMVRNITGTILEVGRGIRSLDSIQTTLSSRNRGLAGKAAPAHGLFLQQVLY